MFAVKQHVLAHIPLTVTRKSQSARFPLLSVASHVTIPSPIPKSDSDAGLQMRFGGTPLLSDASGAFHVALADG